MFTQSSNNCYEYKGDQRNREGKQIAFNPFRFRTFRQVTVNANSKLDYGVGIGHEIRVCPVSFRSNSLCVCICVYGIRHSKRKHTQCALQAPVDISYLWKINTETQATHPYSRSEDKCVTLDFPTYLVYLKTCAK